MGLFGRDEHTDGTKPAPAETRSNNRQNPTHGGVATLIAKGTHVEGEIKGSGEVRIEGSVKGKLDCTSGVNVFQSGKVEGEVKAEVVTVAGTVNGNINGTAKIELAPTAVVEGDITSPRILIREGATFEGQVDMNGKTKPPVATKPKQADKPSEPSKNK